LHNVQGGAFSPSGHLYMNSAPYDDSHGIYGIDTDGSVQTVISYPMAYGDECSVLGIKCWKGEEGEGMDIVDMSRYPNSGMTGQIHMAKLFLHASDDGLLFYHWAANSPLF
jgi:hypothetical protein